MKKHFQRVVSLALCMVLVLGAVSPVVRAFDFSDAISGQYLNQFVDSIALNPGATSIDQLEIYKNKINAWDWAHAYWGANTGYVDIVPDKEHGCLRLQDTSDGRWITLLDGTYPFVPASGDVPDEGASVPAPPSISRNRFVPRQSLKTPYVVITKSALDSAAVKIEDEGTPCTVVKFSGDYYAIASNVSLESEYYALYCNSKDQPYVAVDDRSVTNVDFDYIYNDNTVDNSQHLTVEDMKILDINNNTMNLINDKGQTTNYNIDSLYYDASTKTYTANVYNTTFNTTNNCYEYNYYTYNISYNITNTYITYIGSTAEYTEPYEYYFELPDGRSSADMTAEEVEGISLAFDVCNYTQVATDTHTQSLYHFDGNWTDSSFYSEKTSLVWTKGASITYLDSNAFNGCLYLDQSQHMFSTNLSAALPSDYTIQFRMYFAPNTAAASAFTKYRPNVSPSRCPVYLLTGSNYNYVGTNTAPIFCWDSTGIYWRETCDLGTVYVRLFDTPVGSWADIAVSKVGDYIYFFVNGVNLVVPRNIYSYSENTGSSLSIYKATPSSFSGNSLLLFNFAPGINQFVYLDELRIVNFGVYTGNFQPSPVPWDTNNVFVLPETEELKDLTIAVQSAVPVKGYRVGGVRPTFPDRGMVYLPVENGRAIDCQIYNGTNWESVECRLWTGSRWIPMWAFDILTLSDCWDISDGTGLPPITTETGFWSWWQKEWTDFRAWFTGVFSGGSGGGGGVGSVDGSDYPVDPDEESGENLVTIAGKGINGIWKFISGLWNLLFEGVFSSLAGAITDFIDAFSNHGVFSFYGGTFYDLN